MLTSLLILGITLFVCIAWEAFFSGSDIAFISTNRAKLFRLVKEKNPYAALAKNLLARPEVLFSTTILGTTLAICSATSLCTLFILRYFGSRSEWINLVFLTPLILIFGEFIPKILARSRADALVLSVSRPMVWLSLILSPFTRLLTAYTFFLRKIFGESSDRSFFLTREEIKGALPASRGSDVTHAERQLIERFLEFGRITVKEMLRPLIDVIAIEQNATIRDAIRLFNESKHSKVPVYDERIDRVVGVLHAFDCLKEGELDETVKSKMQPALFVPESKPIDELFQDLKTRPMAIAVNEYGGAEGIVTMEDVMEEVVGEIEDEYDEPPKLFHQIGENSYIVNARIEMDELSQLLRIPLPKDEDYLTLGGFLLKRMQKIPKKWDSTLIDGVEYVVQSATDRSIEEVYLIIHERLRR